MGQAPLFRSCSGTQAAMSPRVGKAIRVAAAMRGVSAAPAALVSAAACPDICVPFLRCPTMRGLDPRMYRKKDFILDDRLPGQARNDRLRAFDTTVSRVLMSAARPLWNPISP